MKRKIIDYHVIENDDFIYFRQQVNVRLREGYVFLGTLRLAKNHHGMITYIREMVKYEE